MHPSTFEYLKPTDEQLTAVAEARHASAVYANILQGVIPEGPDKTYLLRKLREVAMWATVAITRNPDGSSRT